MSKARFTPKSVPPRTQGVILAADYSNGGAFTTILSIAVTPRSDRLHIVGTLKGAYFPAPAAMRVRVGGVVIAAARPLSNALGEILGTLNLVVAVVPGVPVTVELQGQQLVARPATAPGNEGAWLTIIEGGS